MRTHFLNFTLLIFSVFFCFGIPANAALEDFDPTFNGTGQIVTDTNQTADLAFDSAMQPDGKLVIVGYTSDGIREGIGVVRRNPDSSFDNTFDRDGKMSLLINNLTVGQAVRIQPDGKIVIFDCSYTSPTDLQATFRVIRLNTNGSLDTSFGQQGIATNQLPFRIQNYSERWTYVNSSQNIVSMALQNDGKIIVTRTFWEYDSVNVLVRYNSDGSLDTSFGSAGMLLLPLSLGKNSISLAVQTDNKIVLTRGSECENYNNSYGVITRLNEDGSFDESFGERGNLYLTYLDNYNNYRSVCLSHLAIQPDGKILAAGKGGVYEYGYTRRGFVIRVLPNGQLDVGFGKRGMAVLQNVYISWDMQLTSMSLQNDGKILFANQFKAVRLTSNGTLDSSFGDLGIVEYHRNYYHRNRLLSMQTRNNGEITITTNSLFSNHNVNGIIYHTNSDFITYKLDANGILDQTIGTQGELKTNVGNMPAQFNAILIQPDGQIISGGNAGGNIYYNTNPFVGQISLFRHNENGTPDLTFGRRGIFTHTMTGYGNDSLNALAMQPDGKILAASRAIWWYPCFGVSRYYPSGKLDPDFDGDGKVISFETGGQESEARAVAVQPNGKIIAAGYNKVVGDKANFALIRYNSFGLRDGAFGYNGIALTSVGTGDDFGKAMVLQPDGKIVVGGISNYERNLNRLALVRYNSNGSLDNSFGNNGIVTTSTGLNDELNALVLQPDSKLVAVGFSTDFTQQNMMVVRYNPDGTLDQTFGLNGVVKTSLGNSNTVFNAVALQSDGKIVAVGNAVDSLLSSDMVVVRYNADGSLDNSAWSTGAVRRIDVHGEDYANAVAIDRLGRVVVAGQSNNTFVVLRLLGDTISTDRGVESGKNQDSWNSN